MAEEKETTVNNLVEQQAAANKEKENQGANNQQQNGEENVGSGSKGGENLTEDQIKAAALKEQQVEKNPVADLLKELNISSLEELREKLKEKPDENLSEEEKQKREEIYHTRVQQFAVESGDMKLEDFNKLSIVKNKADRDLVFENWFTDWKEENPDVEPSEVDGLAKEAFEKEYNLNSENEKTKTRGENRLKREAGEIRKPLESSYTTVKGKYDHEADIRTNYPVYAGKIEQFVSANIPSEFNVFNDKEGDEEIPVTIPLSADDKKEILAAVAKKIQTTETYSLFKKGDDKAIEEIAKRETENYIWANKREDGLKEIAKKFLERGIAKGSEVGAKNSFALQQDKSGAGGGKNKSSAEQEVLNSLEGKK